MVRSSAETASFPPSQISGSRVSRRQTACEDEDRELRRQAILGMAHYCAARDKESRIQGERVTTPPLHSSAATATPAELQAALPSL
jgi:hypothetical protein